MAGPPKDHTHLLLVRHAETAWNAEYRFQGHADTPLNESGRATIPAVINALRPWTPTIIYTSDLVRAREMAEAAGKALGVPVVADPDLRECSYGAWEGLALAEVRRRHPEELERWLADEGGHARGGGESLHEMQERTWQALERIALAHPGEAVAVLTHSGPIRGAVCRLFSQDMATRYRFMVDNASLTVFRRSGEGRWQLVLLNQTSHLQREPAAHSPTATQPPA
jgi:broad specificity phosphatase PhoE